MMYVRLLSVLIIASIFHTFTLALVPDYEKQALIDLYNATNGPHWSKHTNWGVGDPCEQRWLWVTCDPSNSTVLKVYTYQNRMVGTIPDSVGDLTNLVELDLGTNNLYGSIPDSIWNLQFLQIFDFRITNLTGTIPEVIGTWKNISEFTFFNTKYYGTIPNAFSKMTTLTSISLDENNFTGTIPDLSHLTNLNSLYLNDNLLTGTIPFGLGELSKLTMLQLQDNFLTGTIPFTTGNWFYINLNMSCNCYDSYPSWCFNSSCSPCLEGICNASNAYIYDPVPALKEHSVSINSALGAIVGICIVLAIGSSILLFIKQEQFGEQGSFYSAVVNAGVIIGLVSGLMALPEPTDSLCVAFPWIFGIAFALVYGCLFIKTWTLWTIWRMAKQFKRAELTPLSILVRVGLCVLFEIIFLAIWTAVDPPRAKAFNSAGGDLRRHCVSEKYGYAFWIGFIAYKEAWMVFGLVLTILIKPIRKEQNESKDIALAIYNVFAVSVVAIPLAFALENTPQGVVIIQVGAVLLAFAFTLLAVFFNTWYRIFGPEEVDLTGVRSKSGTPSTSSHVDNSSISEY